MRYIITAILIILNNSTKSFATEETCNSTVLGTEATNLASIVSIPNCQKRKLLSPVKINNFAPLCDECIADFLKRLPEQTPQHPLVDISKAHIENEKKRIFMKIALQEYKKSLTNSLIEITKLRSLGSTHSSFASAISECKQKGPEELKGCDPSLQKQLMKELSDIRTDLSGELAQILSSKKLKDRSTGILVRNDANQVTCFIPEKDILHAKNSAIETFFDEKIINLLSQTNTTSMTTLDELFENLTDKSKNNFESLREIFDSHPVLSLYSKSPSDFVQMLKELNPKTNENFRQELFSKKNGDNFDKKIAEICKNSFEVLSQSICSSNFSSGDIELNSFQYFRYGDKEDLANQTQSDYANTEMLIQNNLELNEACKISTSPGKLKASESLLNISKNLGNGLDALPLKVYKNQKYEHTISKTNQKLCDIQSGKDICVPNTIICDTYQNYKKQQSESTPESRLANSSNEEINSLLRSFIGTQPNLSPEVREVLVAQGIIPKQDGTLVAQPDVPERRTESTHNQDSSNKIGSNSPAAAAKTTTSTPAATAARQQTRSNNNTQNPSGEYNYSNTYKPDSSSQNNDLAKAQEDLNDLRGVQEEIQRRLKGLPKKPTEAEANKIVNDSFKAKGYTPSTPEQTTSMVNDIMQDRSPASTASSSLASPGSNATNSGNRASISGGDSQLKQWEKGRMNEALKEMAGAQNVSNREKIDAAMKDQEAAAAAKLTEVAINLVEAQGISIAEFFKDKLSRNDSETRLLKVLIQEKKPFNLTVPPMKFEVVFNPNNSFNVLLKDGDKKKAESIKPQLEIYLKKITEPGFKL